MKTLQELKDEFLADGVIDANEVAELERVFLADGKIDLEEANILFDINNVVSGKNNAVAWNNFFIRAISSYLLDDNTTPGLIDDDETEWLYNRIKGDGQIDALERELLLNLKSHVKDFPSKLEELL